MRDELGAIFSDGQFASLFPERGKPAFSPWRLALVTVMQFAENLSDRQAANAVRGRLDWKYCLSLELTDPVFDASELCEFRSRLEASGAEMELLDTLLGHFRELGLLRARGRQRTDATHVLANVRRLSSLERVGETMRLALNALARAAPECLGERARTDWTERYALPFSEFRLPEGQNKRAKEAEKIGNDGLLLLDLAFGQDTPAWIGKLSEVQTLRKVWLQNYLFTPEGDLRLRNKEDGLPPASVRIESPTDPECRYKTKGSTTWLGYKVHITESCDEGSPKIITNVVTIPASADDTAAVHPIHEALRAKGLLPTTNVVDMGYMDSKLLLESRDRYKVELLGPLRQNYQWQARQGGGFELADFEIDWETLVATCPEGQKSSSWRSMERRGKKLALKISFSRRVCGACPSRDLCISSSRSSTDGRNPRRELTVDSRERYEALKIARQREYTSEYAREYAHRGGIEGTVSRGVRTHGLRRTRYRGLQRVHLGHALTAAAMNFARVGEWWRGLSSR
ncbi:MAG: IS1182 family transposase, partial [Rubrobacter sp.]|nr:IS1182 family transposase [Rubrobacter sp.]